MNKLNNETLDQMETIAKIAARAVEMIKITLDKAGCTKPEKEPEFAKLADWRGRWLQLDGYECNSNGMLALLRDRFAETVRSIVQRPGYTLFTTESGMMLSSNGYVFTDHDERVTTAKLVRIAMTERIKDHTNPNPGWTTIRTSAACLGDSCELPARIIMSLTASGEQVATHLETFMQATNTRSRSSLNFGHYFPVDQMDKAVADYKSRCKATGVMPCWDHPAPFNINVPT